MEALLKKANIQQVKIKNFISRTTAEELSKLSEPCYFPPFKKDYVEILKCIGLTEKDFKIFVKGFYEERLSQDKILKDVGTNVVLFLLYYFLKIKDQQSYTYAMIYLGIKFYSSELRKFLPSFCNPEIFKYTLDNLNKTHLFYREKSISNAIFHISRSMITRGTSTLKSFDDPEKVSAFVYDYRNRIRQSTRSFANLYYKFSEEGIKITSIESPTDDKPTADTQFQERGQKIIDIVVKNIVVYKQIDKKAFEVAQKITNTNYSIDESIVEILGNLEYTDNLKLIYELFIKDLSDIKQLCGKDFFNYVQSHMAIKRTSKAVFFKQQIMILLNEIIKKSEQTKKIETFSLQTKFAFYLFLAYYLSLYLRNIICK